MKHLFVADKEREKGSVREIKNILSNSRWVPNLLRFFASLRMTTGDFR